MKEEIVIDEEGTNHGSPFEYIWTDKNVRNHPSIGSILNKIDTDKLRNDKSWSEHVFDGEISGSEWADMIDAMKQSDICELKLRDVNIDNKIALSTYFTDKEGKAYVVFRGTAAGEWEDNFQAACVTETMQQQRALDYINSIDAENITVVGHSKGGNKAKYVALLSDKVDRCVSFDGQGFSRLFMDKYEDLIEANKDKITCYALDKDFVNILLYDVYNQKYYIKGHGVSDFLQNHSPNSFFNFYYDGSGKALFYNFEQCKQDETMAALHSFVNYVDSTVPAEDRDELFSFLGTIAAMKMGKDKNEGYTKDYKEDALMKFITKPENADELGLLLAYILEYEEYNNGFTDLISEFLGLSDITGWLFRGIDKLLGYEDSLKNLIENRDAIIKLLKLFRAPKNIIDQINNVGDAYDKAKYEIKPVTTQNTADYDPTSNNNVRDYTQTTRDMLLKLTDEVTNEKPYDVTKWDIWYRMEDWFGLLSIDHYKNNIDDYFKKVIDINGTSHNQMQQIFNNIDATVNNYKNKLKAEVSNLKALSNYILDL
jgi:hypothetical protein